MVIKVQELVTVPSAVQIRGDHDLPKREVSLTGPVDFRVFKDGCMIVPHKI